MAVSFAPYLAFPGNARDAIEFYAGIFGGTPQIAAFGDFGALPQDSPDATKVMHGALLADAVHLYFSDHIEGMGDAPTPGNNISLALMGDDDALLRGYFDALAAGGTVDVPLDKQVWGDIYGAVTDKFGIAWQVNIGGATEPAN